jgi:MFS family permease
MLKPELTEEQRKIAHLYIAYHRISLPVTLAFACFMLVSSIVDIFFKHSFPFWRIIFIVSALLLLLMFLSAKRNETKWLKNLTEEERTLLERAAESRGQSPFYSGKTAKDILKAYHKVEVNAEKELLRASTPSHDGTLLRPTTENHETPKEELLRASEEAK